jgi:hypothetical protein
VIQDDYGHFKGARKAVDEFFADDSVLLTRVDYGARVALRLAPGALPYASGSHLDPRRRALDQRWL